MTLPHGSKCSWGVERKPQSTWPSGAVSHSRYQPQWDGMTYLNYIQLTSNGNHKVLGASTWAISGAPLERRIPTGPETRGPYLSWTKSLPGSPLQKIQQFNVSPKKKQKSLWLPQWVHPWEAGAVSSESCDANCAEAKEYHMFNAVTACLNKSELSKFILNYNTKHKNR